MFDIKKRLSLSFLGEGWDDCYLEFRPALVREMAELANLKPEDDADAINIVNKGIDFLKGKFISGKALRGGKKVNVTKDDLNDFPIDVINECFGVFSGEIEKKK